MSASFRLLILLVLLSPAALFAHPGHGNWVAAFAHPFSGMDHVLAMLAVGMWAAQHARRDSRALWLGPLLFVSALTGGAITGGTIAAESWAAPLQAIVENAVALCVLLLGAAVAIGVRRARVPVIEYTGYFVIGLGGACHGLAHGLEMPAGVGLTQACSGFALGSAVLHSCGILSTLLMTHRWGPTLPRLAGLGVILLGLSLFI